MICKFCGYNNPDDSCKCKFCGHDLESTNNYRDKNGYVRQNISAIVLVVLALAFYFGLTLLYSIIGAPLVASFDFSCLKEGASCSIEKVAEQNALYDNVTTILQVVLELLIVLIAAIIFRKLLKPFFAEFKDKKTYKYMLLGLGLSYGGNFIYSLILSALNLSTTGSANQEAVESSITNNPLFGLLFVVIAAPLFEEIVFRLCLFRSFTHKNKKMEIVGIIVVMCAFAFIHMESTIVEVMEMAKNGEDYSELLKNDLLTLPIYLNGAFAITYTYYKSKNFASNVLVHMVNNGVSYVMILLMSILPSEEEISSSITQIIHLVFRI